MGYLVIKLHEGKNLEAKDHSGTSDPYVSFQLISNETQQVIGKAKSKVVKKTLNPNWNETLQLSISNNPKGHSLNIKVKDWNRIGTKVCMGEQNINLEDWKATEERDLNLNLLNASGSIHLTVSHKPDNKFKVLISYGNEALVEYNLLKGVKLATQLDLLCQLFNTGSSPDSYTLQIKDNEQFITAELLADPKFEIPDNTVIRLMVKPNLQVESVLQALKNEASQKKAIFDLKNQLQDASFAEAFIAKDGIKAVTKLITDSTGNTLAYALGALDACMSFGLGWDTLSPQDIDKIVTLLESQNLNVRSGALKVCSQLASSKNHGYPILNAAIKKLSSGLFQKLVSAFPTSDVLIQLSSLQFINAMLNSAPQNERNALLDILTKENITKILKDQLNTSDAELKFQIARYAKIKFELDKSPTPYDKENPEHEKMLMDLWVTLYPETKLEARVCKQWKLLGFQGNDPATDFRGMGTMALKHLLYASKKYTEDLRTMMQEQEENPETYYPVAVAGINLSKMLYDIFRDAENDANLKYIGMLFEHDHAVEEIYCESLFFFDDTWTEMEATYFNFSNVISIVADRIVDNLSQCKTLQEFRDKCGKGVGSTGGTAANAAPTSKKTKKKTTPFFKRIGDMISSPKTTPNAQQNKKQESLHQAVKEGNTKKVSDLIRDGANLNELNETGYSPLHIAVINGNLDMVRLLLWKDAEVDIKNQAGWTPLHEAAKNSSLEICAVLLHKNANPSAETADGNTPFHYLVSRRFVDNAFHQEVMNDMLARGVNINHNTNSNAETPLFYAVTKGLNDVVSFLIQHGADVNTKNRRGYTPLHIAILQADKPVVETLVSSGADITIAAKEGTPMELAKNNPPILDILTGGKSASKPLPQPTTKTATVAKPLPIPGKKVLPPIPMNSNPRASLKATSPPVKKSESTETQITCYHGQLTREQAEQILLATKKDSFLLRASSVRGCYAMTVYKPAASELTHFLVSPRSGGGYSIQDCDDTNTYPTLNELIAKSPIVKSFFPVPPKTNTGAPPVKTPVQTPAKVAHPPAQNENYYGTAPTITEEDILKPKIQELQKLLASALADLEKPGEWAKSKPNLKKAVSTFQSILN